jgi:hypothetical protein
MTDADRGQTPAPACLADKPRHREITAGALRYAATISTGSMEQHGHYLSLGKDVLSRATPTDLSPCLGKPLSSSTKMPGGVFNRRPT